MPVGKTLVIDFHCHAGTAERLREPWTTRADLSAYLERAREAGIDRTVVFAITCDDYERANAEVAEIVAEHPGRLIGFARVQPRALHPGLELHKIRLLKLNPEEEALILGENARRLLQL